MGRYFSSLTSHERGIPVALFCVTVLSFGLLIPWLGFYWDDWPVVYLTQTQGTAGFWDFYQYDRPFSAWTYIVFTPLLGTSPLAWQVFTLALRWLTSFFIWASLRQIWPNRPHQVLWVALLFAVAPVFTQQPVSVAYSQHWLCYLLFFCSVYLMLRALNEARYFYLFMVLALITSLVQMLTMEYFLGLELLRPLLLWFYVRERNPGASVRHGFRRVAAYGSIFFLSLIVYAIWRMFFLRLAGEDPNRPELLQTLLTTPHAGLLDLTQKAIQDFVYLVTSWMIALKPVDIELHRPFSIAVIVIAVVSAALVWVFVNSYQPRIEARGGERWHAQAMMLGALAIFLGTLPVWLIGRQVSVGPLGGRFSLAAIFGISLLSVGFLEWLSPNNKARLTMICLLTGIATHANLHAAKAYQQSWEKQRAFYWQLFWRAPSIPSGTAFISDGEIFSYVGLYSSSMGISLLYPPATQPRDVPYWFFSYWERLFKFPDTLVAGTVLEEGLRDYTFRGHSHQAILLDFSPELNRCLHLISPEDESDPDLPESMRRLSSISNLSRIERTALEGWTPPASIFGPEPKHTWCYYFEKAALAHQFADWEEIIRLMNEAKSQGFAPSAMKEYLPLLDAYLRTGEIELARSLSLQMVRLSNNIDDRVCQAWLDALEMSPDPELENAFEEVRERSACFD